VIFAVVLALVYPKALDLLVSTYPYSAAGLLIPIFVGFFFRNTNKINHRYAISSIILGVLCAATAQIIGTRIPYVGFCIMGFFIGFLLFYYIYREKACSKEKKFIV